MDDNQEEIAREDERAAVVAWLRGLRPATLRLRPDSTPMTVLFAVRCAIIAGVHDMAPMQAERKLAELFDLTPLPDDLDGEWGTTLPACHVAPVKGDFWPLPDGDPIYETSLAEPDLELAPGTIKALADTALLTIGNLAWATFAEVRGVKGIGPTKLYDLRCALQRVGTDIGCLRDDRGKPSR